MYRERMIGYYPQVIQSILEFKAIVESEYPEFDELGVAKENVLSDAYLTTMGEARVEQWESALGIVPIEGSSVEDRRETVIARLRGQGKLNSSLIKTIVKTFTGAECDTWIENGTLYVRLEPSRTGKEYKLDNVIQELKIKLPTHLELNVDKKWQSWDDVNANFTSWQAIRNIYGFWSDVMYNSQEKANQLDYSTLDTLYLG